MRRRSRRVRVPFGVKVFEARPFKKSHGFVLRFYEWCGYTERLYVTRIALPHRQYRIRLRSCLEPKACAKFQRVRISRETAENAPARFVPHRNRSKKFIRFSTRYWVFDVHFFFRSVCKRIDFTWYGLITTLRFVVVVIENSRHFTFAVRRLVPYVELDLGRRFWKNINSQHSWSLK